jgi:hypothetical protein
MGTAALTQPIAKVLSERTANRYVELFYTYLRTPASEHQRILKSMGEVLSKVPSKPIFSAELMGLVKGVDDMALLKPVIRHQWHDIKRGHLLHHHRTISL